MLKICRLFSIFIFIALISNQSCYAKQDAKEFSSWLEKILEPSNSSIAKECGQAERFLKNNQLSRDFCSNISAFLNAERKVNTLNTIDL